MSSSRTKRRKIASIVSEQLNSIHSVCLDVEIYTQCTNVDSCIESPSLVSDSSCKSESDSSESLYNIDTNESSLYDELAGWAISYNITHNAISERLKLLKPFIPNEFSRKTRTLREIDHFKATEFRLLLLVRLY
jgi:hypothetical protein